jgi:hypothetical protein
MVKNRSKTTRKHKKPRKQTRRHKKQRRGGSLYCPPGQIAANQESYGGFCAPWDSTYTFLTGKPYV